MYDTDTQGSLDGAIDRTHQRQADMRLDTWVREHRYFTEAIEALREVPTLKPVWWNTVSQCVKLMADEVPYHVAEFPLADIYLSLNRQR
jgi:hypothetical protein